jgi:hypothetical protein
MFLPQCERPTLHTSSNKIKIYYSYYI